MQSGSIVKRVIAPIALLAGLCLLQLTMSSCDDAGTAAGCSIDKDCPNRGTVCGEAGECVTVQCSSRSDCGPTQTCTPEGTCTASECVSNEDCASFGSGFVCKAQLCSAGTTSGCTSDTECTPTGQVCNILSGQCETPSGCTADSECSADKYCAASGQCQPGCRVDGCEGGLTCDLTDRTCKGADCTASECAAQGMACDLDSGQCAPRSGKAICETCTLGTEECGGPGDRCAALGGTSICTFACGTSADCPSGFECQPITTTASGCIPLSRTCEGCFVSGCNTNEVCNPETAACDVKTANCAACENSIECGNTATCTAYQGLNRCLEKCVNGTCPSGSTCNTGNGTCEPDTGACTSCSLVASTCTTQGMVLDEEACACVTCLVDGDCTTGLCAQGVGQCVPGTGACLSDAECTTGHCFGYLGTERSGVCVECNENAHCNGATCNNHTCAVCSCPPPQTCNASGQCITGGSCTSDAECENSKGAGWMCDPASSKCYTPGTCDPGDPSIAPCTPPTTCGAGMLGNSCQGCDMVAGGCRPGETCLSFGIPGFDLGCIGGLGF